MEVSFSQLREKEIVNVFDGKKLGRVIDVVFENSTGLVKGIVVPGERKMFRKNEDIFIPLDKLKKIGDDVVLVSLQTVSVSREGIIRSQVRSQNGYEGYSDFGNVQKNFQNPAQVKSYVRYKRIDNKKYK